MIDHDHVDPRIARGGQRLVRHRAAIDRDDQARSLFAQLHQRLSTGAVAFQQPVRDIIVRLAPEHAEQADQQSGGRCSIDIVIAVDGDLLARQDGLCEPIGGNLHILEDRRVGQESGQFRIALALQGIQYEPVNVVGGRGSDDLKKQEYLDLNTSAVVPTLVDGDSVLTQSIS